MTNPKRPRDTNQLARLVVGLATGEANEPKNTPEPEASGRARRAGKAGGKARAEALDPARKKEIAEVAAKVRWAKG